MCLVQIIRIQSPILILFKIPPLSYFLYQLTSHLQCPGSSYFVDKNHLIQNEKKKREKRKLIYELTSSLMGNENG